MQYIIFGEESFYKWINKTANTPGNFEDRLWGLIAEYVENEKEYYKLSSDETVTGEEEIFCFTVEEDDDDVLVFNFDAEGECPDDINVLRNRAEFSYN